MTRVFSTLCKGQASCIYTSESMHSRKEFPMNNFETMRERAVAEPHARNLWHGFRTAAFLLVLLAAPGHAQPRASGEFNDSTATLSPTKAGTISEDKSIRPFHVRI